MPIIKETQVKGGIIGRIDHGSDLLEALTGICAKKGIKLGRLAAIGAVQKAKVGYYNQDTHQYKFIEFDRHMEILSLIGNISLKDGKPMVHAHVTLSDDKGNAFGGHLAPGTIVFACEYEITELEGPTLERGLDQVTGLPLWPMD